jgi:hypothetical protein
LIATRAGCLDTIVFNSDLGEHQSMPMQADLADIERWATDLARRVVGKRLRGVQVLTAQDRDGDEVLRVVIEASALDEVSDDALITLIEQIEDTVVEKDDRFPTVYFAEAA